MKKSEFKRVNGKLPKSGMKFLKESGFFGYGGVLDAWVKGDIKTSKNWILVMLDGKNDNGLNVTLFRKSDKTIGKISNDSMYQTFLTHKKLRLA